MNEAKNIMALHFKLDEDLGIISYDTIRQSDEFTDKSHEACRTLFIKLHRKYKDKLGVLFSIIYYDEESQSVKSDVLSEQAAEALAQQVSLIDLDYYALYLLSKDHSPDFIKTQIGRAHLTQYGCKKKIPSKPNKENLECDKQLKKINPCLEKSEVKAKRQQDNGQNIFSNNSKSKPTLMSFFKKN